MEKSNKFWKGVMIGALAGGAVTLFDRKTRASMKECSVKAVHQLEEIVKNPRRISTAVKETAQKVKTTVEQVGEDLSFISEKVEELRETTPQVTQLIKETKETFTKKEEEPESQHNDLTAV